MKFKPGDIAEWRPMGVLMARVRILGVDPLAPLYFESEILVTYAAGSRYWYIGTTLYVDLPSLHHVPPLVLLAEVSE